MVVVAIKYSISIVRRPSSTGAKSGNERPTPSLLPQFGYQTLRQVITTTSRREYLNDPTWHRVKPTQKRTGNV